MESKPTAQGAPIPTGAPIPAVNEVYVELQYPRPSRIFTSGDLVAGKVVVNVASQLTAAEINVKLEAESRSSTRTKVQGKEYKASEDHKLVYKVLQVFPTVELAKAAGHVPPQYSSVAVKDDSSSADYKKTYTLSPGVYEFKFEFSMPLKNHCYISEETSISHLAKGKNFHANQHVSQSLPPSMASASNNTGDATSDSDAKLSNIKYFVKATIHRGAFSNSIRAIEPLTFIPADFSKPSPAELAKTGFTRRQYPLQLASQNTSIMLFYELRYLNPGYINLFNASGVKTVEPPTLSAFLLTTINLPELAKRKSPVAESKLVVDNISVELVAKTTVLAKEFRQEFQNNHPILQQSFLNLSNPSKIINFSDFKPSGKTSETGEDLFEAQIPSNLISDVSKYLMPKELVPNFKTCNIKLDYSLKSEIVVRVLDAATAATHAELLKVGAVPELQIQPNALEVEVPNFQVFNGLPTPAHLSLANEPDQFNLNGELVSPDKVAAHIASSKTKKSNDAASVAGNYGGKLLSDLSRLTMSVGEKNPKYKSQATKISGFFSRSNNKLQSRLSHPPPAPVSAPVPVAAPAPISAPAPIAAPTAPPPSATVTTTTTSGPAPAPVPEPAPVPAPVLVSDSAPAIATPAPASTSEITFTTAHPTEPSAASKPATTADFPPVVPATVSEKTSKKDPFKDFKAYGDVSTEAPPPAYDEVVSAEEKKTYEASGITKEKKEAKISTETSAPPPLPPPTTTASDVELDQFGYPKDKKKLIPEPTAAAAATTTTTTTSTSAAPAPVDRPPVPLPPRTNSTSSTTTTTTPSLPPKTGDPDHPPLPPKSDPSVGRW